LSELYSNAGYPKSNEKSPALTTRIDFVDLLTRYGVFIDF